ncbi:MAG: lipocalin family protein [Ginsengibacter sp.]
MKDVNRFFIIAIASTFSFISCKKKDNCSFSESNFVGSYKIESVTYKMSATSPEIDGTSFIFDPCEVDDITTFNTNHTYTYTDAGTQCTPPGDDTGTWSLNGNTLTFDGAQQNIDSFDCTGFVFSQTDYDTPGDKVTVKLKRQ